MHPSEPWWHCGSCSSATLGTVPQLPTRLSPAVSPLPAPTNLLFLNVRG